MMNRIKTLKIIKIYSEDIIFLNIVGGSNLNVELIELNYFRI